MPMSTWFTLRAAATLVLSALLIACGKNSPTGSSVVTTPTPAPIVQRVIAEGSASGLQPFDIYVAPTIQVPESGRLEVTVDWTFPTDDVDAHLARGTCDLFAFLFGGCNIVALSTSVTAKPERLTVASATAGPYTLLIPNFGPGRESIAYQVVLTTGGGSAAAASTTAGTASPEKLLALRAAAGY